MIYPDVYFNDEPLLPAGPLFDAFAAAGHTSIKQISATTGVATSILSKTASRGTINAWVADHLTIRYTDRHPVDVYDDQWLDPAHYRAGRADAIFEELTGIAS